MSSDSIASSYKNIQKNITLIESGTFNHAILKEIELDFYNLMDGIKIYLITNKDTYYGTFFLNLSFEADFGSPNVAGIKLNTFPPVFVANPLLLCKFSIKEIMFVVCHEIEHIILRHPIEMVKANPYRDPTTFELFNYAADASVNDRIINEALRMNYKFLKMPDGCIDSNAFAQIFKIRNIRPVESYVYYFDLIKGKKDPGLGNAKQRMMNGLTKSDSNEKSNNSSQAQNGDQNEDLDGDPIESLHDQDNKESNGNPNDNSQEQSGQQGESSQEVVSSKNGSNYTDHNWEENTDIEEMEANLREYVKQSYQQMSGKVRGKLPGYIKEEIEKCNEEPVISWQSLLKNMLVQYLQNQNQQE